MWLPERSDPRPFGPLVPIVPLECEVRYSMRVIISVLLGFFTGFTGLGEEERGFNN